MEQPLKLQFSDSVPILILPSLNKHILLPNVNVAEFVSSGAVEPMADSPGWLLGLIEWRGVKVPLISFERLNGDVEELPDYSDQVAVLNGISGREELPFYAMCCAGIPRQARVGKEDLRPDEAASSGHVEASQVMLAGEAAVIPDLVVIEAQICRVLMS